MGKHNLVSALQTIELILLLVNFKLLFPFILLLKKNTFSEYDIIETRNCLFAKGISFHDAGILGYSTTDCYMTSLYLEDVNKPATVFSFFYYISNDMRKKTG